MMEVLWPSVNEASRGGATATEDCLVRPLAGEVSGGGTPGSLLRRGDRRRPRRDGGEPCASLDGAGPPRLRVLVLGMSGMEGLLRPGQRATGECLARPWTGEVSGRDRERWRGGRWSPRPGRQATGASPRRWSALRATGLARPGGAGTPQWRGGGRDPQPRGDPYNGGVPCAPLGRRGQQRRLHCKRRVPAGRRAFNAEAGALAAGETSSGDIAARARQRFRGGETLRGAASVEQCQRTTEGTTQQQGVGLATQQKTGRG
jgi:hypothetical protein